jgi:hypothetical protein
MTTDNESLQRTYDSDTGQQAGASVTLWDWRNAGGRNFITPSQDQGACQASTGFAVADTMNARLRILLDIGLGQANQTLVPDLSAADVFYCGGGSCTAGQDVEQALNYATDRGVVPAYNIPYKPSGQTCGRGPAELDVRVTKIAGFITQRRQGAMQDAIQTRGPIIAVLRAYQDLKDYRGGLYKYNGTAPFLYNQTVSVIGFTTDGWLCKNSWGPGWGMAGVFLIAYGECGIDDEWMWEISGFKTIYPNGTVTGTPAACVTRGAMHVLYRDNYDEIQDLSAYPPSATQPFNLDGLAAGGNPVVIVNKNAQLHAGRIDILGNLQDNSWDNGWSTVQWLTGPQGLTAGPPAVGDPTVIPFNDELHYFYRDGEGHLQHVWFDGKNWKWEPIKVGASGQTPPLAAGAPKVANSYNTLHVCYRDIDGIIQDVFGWPAPYWTIQQLSGGNMTFAPTAVGDPTVVVYNNNMHVIYRDRAGVLQDIFWADKWTWATLPTFKFAGGDPIAVNFNAGIHVFYRDRDGNVCDTYFAGGWAWQQLTGPGSVTGGLQAIGDPMPVAISNTEMHVHYCDVNSNLSDVYWDGRAWRQIVRI